MHAYMENPEWLKAELARVRQLLEAAQQENYENIRGRASLHQDPLLGGILKLRAEVEGLRTHEAELIAALGETREELRRVKDFALDEEI